MKSIFVEEMCVFWLTEIFTNMLLSFVKRVGFIMDWIFPLLLEELLKDVESLYPLFLLKIVLLVLSVLLKEQVSSSLFVQVPIIFSVRSTCHFGALLWGKNIWVYFTSWSFCVLQKLILIVVLESVESSCKDWVFNYILSIVSPLLLKHTGISQLLVECILIDHSFVEFRLNISSLESLFFFTSFRVSFMIFHLVKLFKLIIVLVDFSF